MKAGDKVRVIGEWGVVDITEGKEYELCEAVNIKRSNVSYYDDEGGERGIYMYADKLYPWLQIVK